MDEREITIREIVDTVVAGKKVIFITAFAAVVFSFVFSFFLIAPSYESETVLMVSDYYLLAGEGEDVGLRYPVLNVEAYKEKILSPEVLSNVIKENFPDTDSPVPDSFKNRITVETVENTNLLRIRVSDSDSQKAADLANSLAKELASQFASIAAFQAEDALAYLNGEIANAEKEMEESSGAYEEFIAANGSIDELKSEEASMINLLTDFKLEALQLERNIASRQAYAAEAEELLDENPEFITVYRSLLSDASGVDLLTEDAEIYNDVIVESIEINEAYTELEILRNSARLSLASDEQKHTETVEDIAELTENLRAIQTEIAKKSTELIIIDERKQLASDKYKALLKKTEEVKLAESEEIIKSTITVYSSAYPAANPVSPNRLLNIALALVLGVTAGVSWIFLKQAYDYTE